MDDKLRHVVDDFYTSDVRVLQSHERLLNRIIDDMPDDVYMAILADVNEN